MVQLQESGQNQCTLESELIEVTIKCISKFSMKSGAKALPASTKIAELKSLIEKGFKVPKEE